MFVLFLKQNFTGIHWMLQLRQFHSFWKEYKSISVTELLQRSNTESACACALSFFSWKMLGNFQCLHRGCFLTPWTQILLGIRTPEGLHQLSCDEVHSSPALLKPRPISPSLMEHNGFSQRVLVT